MQSLRVLLAPGAGAPSSSPWMRQLSARLEAVGPVTAFDYPYQLRGKRMPDPLPRLIEAHRKAFEEARAQAAHAWLFAGKSMGSRVGCHLSVELEGSEPRALVCFGYPLIGQNGARRDEILLQLRRPILFVQGTRDPLCPLGDLEQVRARLDVPNELHVVEGGDHSLDCLKRDLLSRGITQEVVNAQIDSAVRSFVQRYVLTSVGTA
ncbi:MAG TPA: alpha/beta family hydrolase [Polyangiaceae bacterium]|nr:alpha/beta family hydrolase [Polyangiaceae bacterium]